MNILAFSLSLREGSFNTQLIAIAAQHLKAQGAIVETLDLKNFQMPYYNEDIQNHQGFPETANMLKAKMEAADALLIASPEYNFSYPGHFKNTFDWLSRFKPMPFYRKSVLLLSASFSLVGGNRGLWHLRVPFEACGAVVFPDMFSLASAHEAFKEGRLKETQAQERLEGLLKEFLELAQKRAS